MRLHKAVARGRLSSTELILPGKVGINVESLDRNGLGLGLWSYSGGVRLCRATARRMGWTSMLLDREGLCVLDPFQISRSQSAHEAEKRSCAGCGSQYGS